MHQNNSDYGAHRIGLRAVVTDGGEDDYTADEKYDDELERRHLRAGPAAQNTHDQNQKKVTDDGVKDGVHTKRVKLLRHDVNCAVQRLKTRHAHL